MIERLPEVIVLGWKDHEGPVILTTVNASGMPNTIYVGCIGLTADGRIAICDNYFYKTFENIKNGCKGTILFMSKASKAYQVKGTLQYHAKGPLYDEMLTWADSKHPRKGVAILNAEEIYSGGHKILGV